MKVYDGSNKTAKGHHILGCASLHGGLCKLRANSMWTGSGHLPDRKDSFLCPCPQCCSINCPASSHRAVWMWHQADKSWESASFLDGMEKECRKHRYYILYQWKNLKTFNKFVGENSSDPEQSKLFSFAAFSLKCTTTMHNHPVSTFSHVFFFTLWTVDDRMFKVFSTVWWETLFGNYLLLKEHLVIYGWNI